MNYLLLPSTFSHKSHLYLYMLGFLHSFVCILRERERDGEHFCSVQATVTLGNEASRDETPASGNRARNHNEFLGP